MTKFTKGEWKYMNDGTIRACRPNSALLINIILLAGFKDFKKVLGEEKAREMIDANGRLAAAAPEMYEMLDDCLEELTFCESESAEDLKDRIIALFERIDGEGSKS